MKKPTVLVLGASGMLGSMVVDVLARDGSLSVIATVRTADLVRQGKARLGQADWRVFKIGSEAETAMQLRDMGPTDWVVNAIGLTKPYIHDDDPIEIQRALVGNALFPHILAHVVGESGGRVLQIATDCVYSGSRGRYVESDKHDALDVYGKTKSLGEALLQNLHCLRCSIVGPEPKIYAFLLEWFRRQPQHVRLKGYTNHNWNGITTLHFAKLCRGIIRTNMKLPHIQHIVPKGEITKYELLRCFASSFGRQDITIMPVEASCVIDRTLDTENETLNHEIWNSAGYDPQAPTIPEMVEELAAFDYRFAELIH